METIRKLILQSLAISFLLTALIVFGMALASMPHIEEQLQRMTPDRYVPALVFTFAHWIMIPFLLWDALHHDWKKYLLPGSLLLTFFEGACSLVTNYAIGVGASGFMVIGAEMIMQNMPNGAVTNSPFLLLATMIMTLPVGLSFSILSLWIDNEANKLSTKRKRKPQPELYIDSRPIEDAINNPIETLFMMRQDEKKHGR